DALVAPQARGEGFLDTAVVVIRYDNGAIATAEASFSAMYGYDVRGEVFGSAGMAQMGALPSSDARLFDASGMHAATAGPDTTRFHAAYVAEFDAFVRAIGGEELPSRPTGADGLAAQLLAEAALLSHAARREGLSEEIARCGPPLTVPPPRHRPRRPPSPAAQRWCTPTCRWSSGFAGSEPTGPPPRSGTGPARRWISSRSPRPASQCSP